MRGSSSPLRFAAPWSTALVLMSTLATLLCLGVSIGCWGSSAGPHLGRFLRWSAELPLVVLVGGALFTVRGYTLAPNAILVHRLLWSTSLPRQTLESARVEPEALRHCIRTFGNGGLFSWSGWFYSPALGNFRAFMTNFAHAVVLRYPGHTVVVSPGDPAAFVRELAGSSPSATA